MQANKANGIAGYLRDIIRKNRSMSPKSKMKIYKICARLTYAAETRLKTSRTKRILRTTEMKKLRTIRGVIRRESKK